MAEGGTCRFSSENYDRSPREFCSADSFEVSNGAEYIRCIDTERSEAERPNPTVEGGSPCRQIGFEVRKIDMTHGEASGGWVSELIAAEELYR